MRNGKIRPSADAKPLNRSTPNLKRVITSWISSSKQFGLNPPRGFCPNIRDMYTFIHHEGSTVYIHQKPSNVYVFFRFFRAPAQKAVGPIFALNSHTTWFCAGSAFCGWDNLILIFYRFIRKIEKFTMAPIGKFKKINCHNSSCTQNKVVIIGLVCGIRGLPI